MSITERVFAAFGAWLVVIAFDATPQVFSGSWWALTMGIGLLLAAVPNKKKEAR